ncbi:hypothetical protein T484DRAFT_1780274 [Baffinella frigidus]|nr:hypothetical protein T484DRAFT_1780274 [Cryptophyta sp. CCMP2293]
MEELALDEEELQLVWVKYERDDSRERVSYRGQLRGRSKAGLGCMDGKGGVRYDGHWRNNQVPRSHLQLSSSMLVAQAPAIQPHHSDLDRYL